MKIVILDGYSINPGDLSWDVLKQYGKVTVHSTTPAGTEIETIGGCVFRTPVHAIVKILGCSIVPQLTSTGGTGASRTLPFQCCFAKE